MGSQGAVTIQWPDGQLSFAPVGQDWLTAAAIAGMAIPTGCLGGSCGACEIEVNGETQRACISQVPASLDGTLRVEMGSDPYW
ncbi:MAG: 2Fe-2S iron-sulfur cluster-binding protein [Cyanobacteria bacterium]|nr:2Fe-2S iron-sulfur cluster-binding protein [Cyanobacteriota bacterium]